VVFHLENKNMNIGKRIKELRLANQLTQDELAVRSDLSAAFISMLERNKSSVSIEYLTKVLTVLGESLSDFFSSDSKKAYVFEKKDRVEMKDQGIDKFELLIPSSTTMAMEPSKLLIAKNQKLGPIKPHTGEEIGYVIKGRILICLGKRKQFAKAGCCFQYKADQEHSFENVGKSAAEILLITWPPQF
jgi:transcriptional regulator with XRE-family HTH domain